MTMLIKEGSMVFGRALDAGKDQGVLGHVVDAEE